MAGPGCSVVRKHASDQKPFTRPYSPQEDVVAVRLSLTRFTGLQPLSMKRVWMLSHAVSILLAINGDTCSDNQDIFDGKDRAGNGRSWTSTVSLFGREATKRGGDEGEGEVRAL